MMNFYENLCFRCDQTVYQVDRVGPLKDFTFFHQGCFKCSACGTKLTLKTYYNNQDSNDDKEVYCVSHVPKIGPGHLDGSAVGIRSALNVPKSFNYVNEQIRGGGKGTFDAEALAIKPHLNNGRQHSGENGNFSDHQYGRFDASALHIAHALRATELQRSYRRPIEKPLDSYLVSLDHMIKKPTYSTSQPRSFFYLFFQIEFLASQTVDKFRYNRISYLASTRKKRHRDQCLFHMLPVTTII